MSGDHGESKVWATGGLWGPVGVGGLVGVMEKVMVLGRGQIINFGFTKQKVHKKIRRKNHFASPNVTMTKAWPNNV